MKQLKILIANQTFDILAGSETWMQTLATELLKRGHEVTAYSPQLGFMATKLEAIGVKCVKELESCGNNYNKFNPVFEEDFDSSFDLVICAHYEITKYIKSKIPNVPIVAVCHGIIHKNPDTGEIFPEHPVTEFKVDQYIAVSEEVQDLLDKAYGIKSEIVRNFFDLDKFKKSKKISKKPRKFLVNSNYWGPQDEVNKIIKEVSMHYSAEFIGIGAGFSPSYEVEKILEDVDIVFGMGRSVIEGACMGKLAVVHGRWGTGGVLTTENYKDLSRTNFSGRAWQGERGFLTAEEIIEQIDKYYNQKNIDDVYKLIEKDHNVKLATERILSIGGKLK